MKSANIFCKHWPTRGELLTSGSQEAGGGRVFRKHSSSMRQSGPLPSGCLLSGQGKHRCIEDSPQGGMGPPKGVELFFRYTHATGPELTGSKNCIIDAFLLFKKKFHLPPSPTLLAHMFSRNRDKNVFLEVGVGRGDWSDSYIRRMQGHPHCLGISWRRL